MQEYTADNHRVGGVAVGPCGLRYLQGAGWHDEKGAGRIHRPDQGALGDAAGLSLRPPRRGAKRPQEVQPQETAKAAILAASKGAGQTDKASTGATDKGTAAQPTGGELALLQKAGAKESDASIRQIVNRETSVLAEKDKSFADRLLFWQDKPAYGAAVDAGKEAKRLREAAAAGDPPNKGETPIIKRRKRGWLEGVF